MIFYISLYCFVLPELWALVFISVIEKYPSLITEFQLPSSASKLSRSVFTHAFNSLGSGLKLPAKGPKRTLLFLGVGAVGWVVHEAVSYQQHRETLASQQNMATLDREDVNRRWATEQLDKPDLPESRKQVYSQIAKTGKFPTNDK